MGVAAYAKKYRPSIMLLENVASLFSKRKVEQDGHSAQLAKAFASKKLLVVSSGSRF